MLGVVAGVGFTMALFIAQLAFTDATAPGGGEDRVLAASGARGAAVLGVVLGRLSQAGHRRAGNAIEIYARLTPDELAGKPENLEPTVLA